MLLGQTPCLATHWGGSLHGGEQWGGVVGDMVQVGTDIKAVNHVVGVPLPGHPEVESRESRCLGSPCPGHKMPVPCLLKLESLALNPL